MKGAQGRVPKESQMINKGESFRVSERLIIE